MSLISKVGQTSSKASLLVRLKSSGGGGGTTDLTSSAGSNETSLLTSGGGSGEGSGVTDMLLVTTTVGMLDGVHSDTSNSGPSVSLGSVLVGRSTSLEEGLVGSLATSNNTNHGSVVTLDGLSDTGRKSNSGSGTLFGVTDNDGGGTGSSSVGATITELGLNVGNDGTFGHLINRHDVANGQTGFLSCVDVHSRVHSLDSNEVLSALFVSVLVSEDNFGERSTSAGVMDNVPHNTLNVTLSLGIIDSSEAGGCNSFTSVCFESSGFTVTLS
jgi:hypothetical protein